jgi:hypothetical protein
LKSRQNIVCFLNLALFLVSFSLVSFVLSKGSSSPSGSDYVHFRITQKSSSGVVSPLTQVSEKIENENDTPLIAVYPHTFFFCEPLQRITRPAMTVTVTPPSPADPLYISVRNFRI